MLQVQATLRASVLMTMRQSASSWKSSTSAPRCSPGTPLSNSTQRHGRLVPLTTRVTSHPGIDLQMERPLHAPAVKLAIAIARIAVGIGDMNAAALNTQFIAEKAALAQHVRRSPQQRTQVSLTELLASLPLQQGLAELGAQHSSARSAKQGSHRRQRQPASTVHQCH